MPCYDPMPYETVRTVVDETAKAGLCALITALYKCSPLIKDVVVSNIDWKKAGITPKQLDDWYRDHRLKESSG